MVQIPHQSAESEVSCDQKCRRPFLHVLYRARRCARTLYLADTPPCDSGSTCAKTYMKTVSIIIPCYRDSAILDRAIKSVLAQSYPVIEIIVVNDYSPESKDELT